MKDGPRPFAYLAREIEARLFYAYNIREGPQERCQFARKAYVRFNPTSPSDWSYAEADAVWLGAVRQRREPAWQQTKRTQSGTQDERFSLVLVVLTASPMDSYKKAGSQPAADLPLCPFPFIL